MTNRIAIVLATLIVAFLLYDNLLLGGSNTLFLLRKFAALLEWIAFWH